MGKLRSKKLTSTAMAIGALGAMLALAACGGDNGGDDSGGPTTAGAPTLPQGSEPVNLDPADFTTEIDNPYWPMSPGSRWVYKETDKEGTVQRVVVTVTDQTKTIANGVEARVVHDVVSEDGEPVEVTDDWYAQDSAGNVWYLGEDTAEYKNGKVVSREGSFEAGVDGAQPGIIDARRIPKSARLPPGVPRWRGRGHGEGAQPRRTGERPFGSFDGVLETEDINPLNEPKPAVEHKYFARDVGPVLAVGIAGGGGREELVSYTK